MSLETRVSNSEISIDNKVIVMVWAPYEDRTASYAEALGVEAFYIHYLLYKRPYLAPFKYIMQAFKTWQVLSQEKPTVVYVTNPPVFAALIVWFCQKILRMGGDFVMDTHPPAIYSKKWSWSQPLQKFAAKRALINITDQVHWEKFFENEWGSEALVLENPIERDIDIDAIASQQSRDEGFSVGVVNTFAGDEPLQCVLDAAKLTPEVTYYITGEKSRAPAGMIESAPENVQFVGYLNKDEYFKMVYRSHALIVLTTFEYSLVGGGMDGVVMGRPVILSDQPALRAYFTEGALFVQHTGDSIADAVKQAQDKEAELIESLGQMAEEKTRQWKVNFEKLKTLLDSVER